MTTERSVSVWFKVEESALADPRISVLGARLGMSRSEAFEACCRVWCWLYRRGGQVLTAQELEGAAQRSGFANAMLDVGLADECPEGIRIKGAWRAEGHAAFVEQQRAKSKLGVAARKAKSGTHEHTDGPNGSPNGSPPGEPNIILLSDLDLKNRDPGSNPRSNNLDLTHARSTENANQLPLIPLVGRKQKPIAAKDAAALAAAEEWIGWFGRCFSRRFTVTVELVKQVGALLQRGYSEKPDMRGVALYLASQWEGDERMAAYLRPSTILVASKFAERLDLAKEWDRMLGCKIWKVANE